MKIKEQIFDYPKEFELESGKSLPGFQLNFHCYGSLNHKRDNVIWVCHALTGSSQVLDWWSGLFGPGTLFDPAEYFIICANTLGGCYGSTGPLSQHPHIGKPYYLDFPFLTNHDIVKAFDLLRQHLAIPKIHCLIGGSLGGQQVVEWAVQQPHLFDHIIGMATNAFHSPWGIAFNESQRMAIENDPSWLLARDDAGKDGMKTARSIALLSYRHYNTYHKKQSEEDKSTKENFRASSYQRYQGEKIARRFNAYTYWYLSKAMDAHHVGRHFTSTEEALARIQCPALYLGINTDILFPPQEQQYLARLSPKGQFIEISSDYGHDGFLVELDPIAQILREFLGIAKKVKS